jgi:peroxiredoxin
MKKILFSFLLMLSGTLMSQQAMYDICPIKNSEEVPNAEVFNQKGESVDLKEYIGNRSVVIVFYRGGWCPFCMRHLAALQEINTQIDSLGFELIAVTPDDFVHLDTSIVKSGGIDYKIFSDKNINAINAFRIGWKIDDELYLKYRSKYEMDTEWWTGSIHHVLPVPSVFVVSNGIIQYQHIDPKYSQRLSSEILLSFLKAVGK